MKTKFFICIVLCAIIFCSCTTPSNDTEATPTVTPKATPVSTLSATPTPTPEPTPTPTPPAIKPEVSDAERKTMLSDIKTYIETVKLKGDIVTVSYGEDIPLSGRYYAKYNVMWEKEELEHCAITTDFYIDLITKEIKAGTCLMPKNAYSELTNKFKTVFTQEEQSKRHIMLNEIDFEKQLDAYCYSIRIVSPGKDFLGTVGWYVFSMDGQKLYEKNIATLELTEIK